MGYSGLIYAAIVAGWAAVLVPRWVRRNEEVERAREIDEARGVRVLQRRQAPFHASHPPAELPAERTLLHGSARGLTVGVPRRPERPGVSPRQAEPLVATAGAGPAGAADHRQRQLDRAYADAARRRRRALLALLLVAVATLGAAALGRLPGWTTAVAGGLVLAFLVVGRRAAVAQARDRRADRTTAGQAQPAAETDHDHGLDETLPRVAVLDEADLHVEPDDPDAWEPVPVPRPTYLSKPMAPRTARTIDLNLPGSWTSGRLDPAGSISLPPAESADDDEVAEEPTQRRRAVGD